MVWWQCQAMASVSLQNGPAVPEQIMLVCQGFQVLTSGSKRPSIWSISLLSWAVNEREPSLKYLLDIKLPQDSSQPSCELEGFTLVQGIRWPWESHVTLWTPASTLSKPTQPINLSPSLRVLTGLDKHLEALLYCVQTGVMTLAMLFG